MKKFKKKTSNINYFVRNETGAPSRENKTKEARPR